METAIQIIWWIGLLGALIPTLIILKEVALVLTTLKNIFELAQFTHKAAEGIAANVTVGSRWADLAEPTGDLADVTTNLRASVQAIEEQLGWLAPVNKARGG